MRLSGNLSHSLQFAFLCYYGSSCGHLQVAMAGHVAALWETLGKQYATMVKSVSQFFCGIAVAFGLHQRRDDAVVRLRRGFRRILGLLSACQESIALRRVCQLSLETRSIFAGRGRFRVARL